MNAIRKAAFAASALAITVVGAALATAPMAFARSQPIAAHHACSTPSLQVTVAGQVGCSGAGHDARLVAFNRR